MTDNSQQQKEDPRKAVWIEELRKLNPDVSPYFLDFMVDCYLLDPQGTERVITNHKYMVDKCLIPDLNQ
jgi:hypothetical protein